MLARILTAAVLIPLVVALVWWGPPALLAAGAAVVSLLALIEFFDLAERMGLRAFRHWTLGCATAVFYAQYSAGFVERHSFSGWSIIRETTGAVPLEAVLLLFILGMAAIGIGTRRPWYEVLPGMAASAAGLLFVALPFSYLVRLDEIEPSGRRLVLFTLLLVWAGDTLAYFVGKALGHLPMAPELSPKKTWEGAGANLIGSLVVGFAFARWMEVDTVAMLLVAALGNLAGQLGDLVESAYKRGAATKDSGSLLPGHGGILDRIDSLILASPVVWATWQWFTAR
jgi:phosphatidate cytidylyltransferase